MSDQREPETVDPLALHAELMAYNADDAVLSPVPFLNAVKAVLELHKPVQLGSGREYECAGCKIKGVAFVWADRCPTVKAVAGALGVSAAR